LKTRPALQIGPVGDSFAQHKAISRLAYCIIWLLALSACSNDTKYVFVKFSTRSTYAINVSITHYNIPKGRKILFFLHLQRFLSLLLSPVTLPRKITILSCTLPYNAIAASRTLLEHNAITSSKLITTVHAFKQCLSLSVFSSRTQSTCTS